MRKTARLFAAGVALSLWLPGCIDDLPEQWELTETRLLSARYTPTSDPERAWAEPGEEGTLEFFITAPPNNEPNFTWGFVLCLGTVAPTGEALCLEAPFQTEIQTTESSEVPTFAVTVPNSAAAPISHVTVLGIFCSAPSGNPVAIPDVDLEAGLESCAPAGGEVNRFQLSIPIDATAPNRHPAFASGGVALAGVLDPWPEPSADPRCDGTDPTRPVLARESGEQRIVLRATAESREPIGDATEDLLFSHAVTAGELDRFFSAPSGDDNVSVDVEWTPPGPGGSSIVRFAFAISDERAGAAWALRELCLE